MNLGSPSEFSLDKNLLVYRVLRNFVRNMKIFAEACEIITMICDYVGNPKGLLNVFHVGIQKMLIYEDVIKTIMFNDVKNYDTILKKKHNATISDVYNQTKSRGDHKQKCTRCSLQSF